jgi:hypothetical protein
MPLLWTGWLAAAVFRRLRHGPLPRVAAPPPALEPVGAPILARSSG